MDPSKFEAGLRLLRSHRGGVDFDFLRLKLGGSLSSGRLHMWS